MIHPQRVHTLRQGDRGSGPVVYWMHRDHRVRFNDGLAHAQATAMQWERPLIVAWFLSDGFSGAGYRQYAFLLQGMAGVERDLAGLGIPLRLYRGRAEAVLPAMVRELDPGLMVTDFDPARIKQGWIGLVAEAATCPVQEVDSRNIAPCRMVSGKKEYAARTIRPRIHRCMDEFLAPELEIAVHPHNQGLELESRDWEALLAGLDLDRSVDVVDVEPGEEAAQETLASFFGQRLKHYATGRNDPNCQAQSELSPYLHFGMLSPRDAVLQALRHRRYHPESVDAFIEELVVRRELSDNFCLFEPAYDRVEGFPDWALKTLDKHRDDPRPFVYSLEEFEGAATHSPLWNAAQLQMRVGGKMHGYMRMYWAKKILEWSESPEEALATVIHLNDRWSLDGRDTNGYAGAAWSIGGVHDRPWKERPVLGTIRYMNANGARRKFDVARYVETQYVSAGREGELGR